MAYLGILSIGSSALTNFHYNSIGSHYNNNYYRYPDIRECLFPKLQPQQQQKQMENIFSKIFKPADCHHFYGYCCPYSASMFTEVEERATQTPRYIYSREQLYNIAKLKPSKKRPRYLSSAYNNSAGSWDPDKWSQDKKKDDDENSTKRERSDSEREQPQKKKTADPKERLKEEQDGIILSPQRRSFVTGCHVTQQPSGSRRPESPVDNRLSERDNHRDPVRRIGSGRIVTRERDFGGFRRDKYERDDRDPRESRFLSRDRPRDNDRRGNRGYHYRVEEEEPEWFSGGPTSQHETIELRGFDDGQEDKSKGGSKSLKSVNSKRSSNVGGANSNSEKPATALVKPQSDRERTLSVSKSGSSDKMEANSEFVVKKKTSLDAEISSSAEKSEMPNKCSSQGLETTTTDSREFDINDFFKMDALPGLFPNGTPPEQNVGLMGSRFGQFFQQTGSPLSPTFIENSRRSSIQDELGPIINDQNIVKSMSEAFFTPINPMESTNQTKSILDLLKNSNESDVVAIANNMKNSCRTDLEIPPKVPNIQDIEDGLKLLVMNSQSNNKLEDSKNSQMREVGGPKKDKDMSAFEKLLVQISDGQVMPAAPQGYSTLGPIDKSKIFQEEDILQHMLGKQPESARNLIGTKVMSVLKNAPTEQDILAGKYFIKLELFHKLLR